MKIQKNIIGLTLAELVFVLVYFMFPNYLFFQDASKKEVQQLQENLNTASEEIEILSKEKGNLEKKISGLREKGKLASKQLPSCIEKGLRRGVLFRVKILGENKYLIKNSEYTYQEILDKYKSDIELARENRCVHSVYVESIDNLNAFTYIKALKKIQMTFYTAIK